MIREGDQYLSLAIPVGDYHPAPETWQRFHKFTEKDKESADAESLMSTVNLKNMSEKIIVSQEELKGFRKIGHHDVKFCLSQRRDISFFCF